MRGHVCRGLRSGSVVLAASLAVLAMVASGCGTQDWERDVLAGLLGLTPGPIIIPPPGPTGPAGAAGAQGVAGQAGQNGQNGEPGPNIIIARAVVDVVNGIGILENSDHVTNVVNLPNQGQFQLTVDLTDVLPLLPAGTTLNDFEVFVTLMESTPPSLLSPAPVPYYQPVSLVGATLTINVLEVTPLTAWTPLGFSVMVLLPAG